MKSNTIKFNESRSERDEKCFLEIANTPLKLRYWKEVSELWTESLEVETHKLSAHQAEIER